MNRFTFSGNPAPAAKYVACRHTATQTHLTGFDTLAEARQYVFHQQNERFKNSPCTLAIVQMHNDQVVYYRQYATARPLARLLSLFL